MNSSVSVIEFGFRVEAFCPVRPIRKDRVVAGVFDESSTIAVVATTASRMTATRMYAINRRCRRPDLGPVGGALGMLGVVVPGAASAMLKDPPLPDGDVYPVLQNDGIGGEHIRIVRGTRLEIPAASRKGEARSGSPCILGLTLLAHEL